jgi:hypothetical protein
MCNIGITIPAVLSAIGIAITIAGSAIPFIVIGNIMRHQKAMQISV